METGKSKTFVLVHGAWVAAWCWDDVAERLRGDGHRVFAPTLTGLGDRRDELSPQVGLGTHVSDVVALIEREQLRGIVLVGHSYGGMVISGVAAALPGTIRALVYLDAFVPESGQSLVDIVGQDAAAAVYGDADPIPPPPMLSAGDAVMERCMARATPHPRASKFERLGDLSARERIPVRTFVLATQSAGGFFDPFAQRLAATPGWRIERIASGHMTMVEAPERTVEILEAVA